MQYKDGFRKQAAYAITVDLRPRIGLLPFFIEFRRSEIDINHLITASEYLQQVVSDVTGEDKKSFITTVETSEQRIIVYTSLRSIISMSAFKESLSKDKRITKILE